MIRLRIRAACSRRGLWNIEGLTRRLSPQEAEHFLKTDCPRPHRRVAGVEPEMDWTEMATGTVKFFNTSKGFGFIAPEGGGKDVFVHATALEASGLRTLNEGQKVSFDIVPDARGAKAANLKPV